MNHTETRLETATIIVMLCRIDSLTACMKRGKVGQIF